MHGLLADIMAAGTPGGTAAAITGNAAMATGLTALGSSQGTAYVILNPIVEFTTVAASTGAILPSVTVGGRFNGADTIFVINKGANALAVYPPVGFAINSIAANTALSVPAAKSAIFMSRGDGNWFYCLSA